MTRVYKNKKFALIAAILLAACVILQLAARPASAVDAAEETGGAGGETGGAGEGNGGADGGTETPENPATPPGVDGDYKFTVDSTNNTVTIIEYTGSGTVVSIPDKLDGKPVTQIGETAFTNNKSITSVTIPEGVLSINDGAQSNVVDGTKSNATDGPKTIGAFYNCTALATVNLPKSLTYIGDLAFAYCDSLNSISIPENVTSIGWCAFFYSKLTSVSLPGSLETIGPEAFMACGLASIDIPDSVTSIGYGAFEECKSLSSVKLPANIGEIESRLFHGCAALASIDIPESVLSIGDDSFYECSSLKTVTMGNNVTEIGAGAFYGCKSLETVKLSENLTIIGSITYPGIDSGLLPLGAFESCSSLKSITLPGSVTSIGSCTFAECVSLKSIVFPAKLEVIGENIIDGCSRLASAEFLGDAPGTADADGSGKAVPLGENLPSDYVTIYQKGASGFTNPWAGYPAREKAAANPTPAPDIKNALKSGSGLQQGGYANIDGRQTLTIKGLTASKKSNTAKTASQFKDLFNIPANQIDIADANGNPVKDAQTMATGMTVKLKDADGNVTDRAAVVVSGDIAGKGGADLSDYAMLKAFRLSISRLNDLQQMAADMNNDGKVTIMDQATIKAIVLGLV